MKAIGIRLVHISGFMKFFSLREMCNGNCNTSLLLTAARTRGSAWDRVATIALAGRIDR